MNTGLQIGQLLIHAECVESVLESARWQKCEGLQPRNADGEVSSMFFYPELFKCEDAGQNGDYLSVELLLKVPWNDFDYGWICFCFE